MPPPPPYIFTDSKGAKWLVRYSLPSLSAMRPWWARSEDYPLEPLSGNEDDVPIRIALTESGLLEDITLFASRHTVVEPKPMGPPAPPGWRWIPPVITPGPSPELPRPGPAGPPAPPGYVYVPPTTRKQGGAGLIALIAAATIGGILLAKRS